MRPSAERSSKAATAADAATATPRSSSWTLVPKVFSGSVVMLSAITTARVREGS